MAASGYDFCLLSNYKQQPLGVSSNFPKIFVHFEKISEDYHKIYLVTVRVQTIEKSRATVKDTRSYISCKFFCEITEIPTHKQPQLSADINALQMNKFCGLVSHSEVIIH